jgi:simple sugar transport system permease protein
MGLAAAVAFRAGRFNIGGEGQLILGAVTSALIGLYLPLPGWLTLIFALLGGAVVGGAYAWLAAWLDDRFQVPLLISSLLSIYPARLMASYLVSHPLRDQASGLTQTLRLEPAVTLPKVVGTRLGSGLIVIVGLVVLAHWFMYRTRSGYRLRMTGSNVRFADYGGIDTGRLGTRVVFVSGAIAGLVGALQVVGVHHRYIDGSLTQPLYAWIGIMVALLAGSRPMGVLLAGVFFAAVQTGGFGMERATDVPREISQVLQALIILLIAARSRLSVVRSTTPAGGSP